MMRWKRRIPLIATMFLFLAGIACLDWVCDPFRNFKFCSGELFQEQLFGDPDRHQFLSQTSLHARQRKLALHPLKGKSDLFNRYFHYQIACFTFTSKGQKRPLLESFLSFFLENPA
jgi:hypothetical protein